MPENKPELSDAMKKKVEPRKFLKKIQFLEQNLLLQFQVQKVELENLHLQQIWL